MSVSKLPIPAMKMPGDVHDDLDRFFDKVMAKYIQTRDLDATIAALRELLVMARRRRDEHVIRLCLGQLTHFSWLGGRLDDALRVCRALVELDSSSMYGWVTGARLWRALGRPKQSIAWVTKALTRLRGVRRGVARQRHAELCFEAGLSAHLLGDYRAALIWLRKATTRLPKSLDIHDRNGALVLLEVCRMTKRKGSPRRVEALAKRSLERAKRDAAAAAVLAVAAWRSGDAETAKAWRDRALAWAAASLGVPFCHDNWQQAHAVLRLIPESARERTTVEEQQ
jgi:tetratricopeptide (TPR) repeat protein